MDLLAPAQRSGFFEGFIVFFWFSDFF